MTNYADDNTPYTINYDANAVIENLENDTSTLIEWFNGNYFKINADKCHLLITNHDDDVSIAIEGETIKGEKSVKLLGINIDDKMVLQIIYQMYARRLVISFMLLQECHIL